MRNEAGKPLPASYLEAGMPANLNTANSDIPMDYEELQRELQNMRRALWLTVDAAGGKVDVRRSRLEEYDERSAKVRLSQTLDGVQICVD